MVIRRVSLLLVAVLFSFFVLSPSICGDNAEYEEVIKLVVGGADVVPTLTPTRIVIGNPSVADIAEVTNSQITVNAKAPGSTTLVFWDSFGEHSLRINVVSEDMSIIKERVDSILRKLSLKDVYTKASDEESKVYILGSVKNPQDRERITVALGTLKERTIDLVEIKEDQTVVEIDVQILELNKDATSTLGLTWPGSIQLTEVGSKGISAVGTKWSTLFKVLNLTRDAFTFKLDALVQEGKVRILSRPRLACQSGKEADMLVGGEKPIFTTTVSEGGSTASTVEYKEYGIKLKIKPLVTEEDKIKVALKVEVSDVGDAETIGPTNAPTGRAYPLTKRNASTELYVEDGQTIAIGGLIKQKTEEDLRKFPWLADVPVLGTFFRKKETKEGGGQGERGDAELFITLTPTIVSKDTSSSSSSLKESLPVQANEPVFMYPEIPEHMVNYVRAVQTKIINAAYYPRQAKSAGWEGTTKISLKVAPNGDLRDIRISESSGYKVLDDAAIITAKDQAPYPPFPPQINSQELWIDVPIIYKKN